MFDLANVPLLRTLLDQALPDALYIHGHDGRLLEVNQRACEALGYSRTELLEKNMLDIEQDLDLPAAQRAWSALQAHETICLRGHHRRRDGSRFPVEGRYCLFLWGDLRIYVIVARDIDLHRQQERNLRSSQQRVLELERERRQEVAERLNRSERRYLGIVEAMAEGLVIHDEAGRIVTANPSAQQILGLDLDQILERDHADARWGAVREDGQPLDAAEHPAAHCLRTGQTVQNQILGIEVAGRGRRWLSINAVPLCLNRPSTPDAALTTMVDITQRKQLERDLARANERNATLLRNASDGIHILDPAGHVIEASESFARALGYRRDEILGMHVTQWDPAASSASMIALVERLGISQQSAQFERVHRRKDGSTVEVELTANTLELDGQTVLFCSSRDISVRKQLERELREMATIDFLTGVATRRSFVSRLEQEIARLRRSRAESSCLLMLDLDHFKNVNDRFGHPTGDEVLKHVARLLRKDARAADAVGRLGGEEFALLLLNTEPESAALQAERLRQNVSGTHYQGDGISIPMTVSIGIAPLLQSDGSAADCIQRADQALYRAKTYGRNRVECA